MNEVRRRRRRWVARYSETARRSAVGRAVERGCLKRSEFNGETSAPT